VNDLRELYQEVILDHSKRPRNFRELPGANRHAEGHNPLCGDRASVYLLVDGDVVRDFHELVTADPSKAAAASSELGKLAVFAGVHEFPMRVKCASLAWHTMKAALEGGAKATTE